MLQIITELHATYEPNWLRLPTQFRSLILWHSNELRKITKLDKGDRNQKLNDMTRRGHKLQLTVIRMYVATSSIRRL